MIVLPLMRYGGSSWSPNDYLDKREAEAKGKLERFAIAGWAHESPINECLWRRKERVHETMVMPLIGRVCCRSKLRRAEKVYARLCVQHDALFDLSKRGRA